VEATDLQPGSRLLLWEVRERRPTEILTTWQDRSGAEGATWFALEHTRDGAPVVYLGSALPPDTLPSATSALRFLRPVLGGLHAFYSRLLLASAVQKLKQKPPSSPLPPAPAPPS
jgi:hypothetical protein